MPEIDLSQLSPVLNEFAPQGRAALLPALHAAQNIYGYLPEEVAAEIARGLNIPPVEVYGVIDFYALFYRHPVGKAVVHICNSPMCSIAGETGIFKRLLSKTEMSSEGQSITIESNHCLGLCELNPAIHVQQLTGKKVGARSWRELFAITHTHPKTKAHGDFSLLTSNCSRGRPTTLEEYQESGGYVGLRKALGLNSQEIIAEIKASGLFGRGGAAFPTGLKWESTAKAGDSPKYVVCNGDEAEPGAFKDRFMMENDPHRILEGMIITALAIGSNKGFFYIRGEYTYQFDVVSHAVKEARLAGYLGENILGSGFDFDVECRQGAGAYVCGEETAQFESIEGKRGLPRVKPPFPTTHGLFGKPTVINNVETLCNVPFIILNGASVYRQHGTEKSPGTKLFSISGDVAVPGLYEVPFGVTFRHILELAGGMQANEQFQGALFGGAAGLFAGKEHLDVRLTLEDLRAAGLAMGAGVIAVFSDKRDMRDVCLRLARFFADESCGKCYPCQIGSQRQAEIVERIASGQTLPGDIERLQDVGATMTDASLCGLGQAAASAVLSAIKLWPDLFAHH